MQTKYLPLIAFMASLLTACAEFSEQEPLPPVFGNGTGQADAYPGVPTTPRQPPPEVVETRPLENINRAPQIREIKPEFLPPADNSLPSEVPQDKPLDQPADSSDPFGTQQPAENTGQTGEPQPEQTQPAELAKPVPPPAPPPPKVPETLQPLETFAPQSPAVGSLLVAANENSQGGNLDSAVSSIERAIRIEPRNATLYYKLAVLRLKQSKPRLAEDIARKAALLAVNDNALKRHSWLLIANARELQNNIAGAQKAKAEAAKY